MSASITDSTCRELFYSTNIRPTKEALGLANKTIITAALEQLKSVTGCTITLAFQPISKSWLKAARASGGDAIDLDPADGGFVGKSSIPLAESKC